MESFPIDDLSSGSNTIEKAFKFYEKSKLFLKDGRFNLRKCKILSWKT